MADKTIGELTRATSLDDDSLLIAEQQGEAVSLAGSLLKSFVENAAEEQLGAAKGYADSAAASAEKAQTAADGIGTAVEDTKANADAAQEAREAIENMLVEAVTLASGNPATVTKELVDGVVKLVFGLPAGDKGDPGDPGAPGNSIQSIDRTSGTGAPGTTDTYTITLTDGSTTSFNVYNGADGIGAGDMTVVVYDPQGKKTDIFKYIDDALEGVDPDVTADEVTFADGENLQQKYDSGALSGEDGEDGADGLTPYIGENENWFIGDTDTGVRAAGQTTTSIQTIKLLASGWSSLSLLVKCDGVVADETKQVVTVFPSLGSRDAYMDASVECDGVGANILSFSADKVPSEDLTVYVAIEEAGQAPLDVYSTEETVVGTWVDGKPIYKKTFIISSITNNLNLSMSGDISDLIAVSGAFTIENVKSPLPRHATGSDYCLPQILNNDIVLAVAGSASLKKPAHITATYTKTTDTATIAIPSAAAMMAAYEEGVDEA